MKDKLQQLIEKTKCSITLEINLHEDNYQTVVDYLSEFPHNQFVDDMPKEIYNKMIETNTIIELYVYPDNPISYYKIYGYDLDMVLDEALAEINKNS